MVIDYIWSCTRDSGEYDTGNGIYSLHSVEFRPTKVIINASLSGVNGGSFDLTQGEVLEMVAAGILVALQIQHILGALLISKSTLHLHSYGRNLPISSFRSDPLRVDGMYC